MELLIIKSGDMYIRVKQSEFFLVGLDKASVFPMQKLDDVKAHHTKLTETGFSNIAIKKLVLHEEDL